MNASPLSAAPASGADLASAMAYGNALHGLLEKEFDALKAQELDRFESLQPEKMQIFEVLAQLIPREEPEQTFERPEWQGFRELIAYCRDLHRRNEVLMSRKLDAIRGALHTLRGADPTAPVEVYDRLGRMSRMRGGRGYEEV
ncbi:MAG: flagellar protein FlgN [Oxalobacteraceae bacterium]|nr:flagellar protein FlgN [Oxalobacteraceae bacterium]